MIIVLIIGYVDRDRIFAGTETKKYLIIKLTILNRQLISGLILSFLGLDNDMCDFLCTWRLKVNMSGNPLSQLIMLKSTGFHRVRQFNSPLTVSLIAFNLNEIPSGCIIHP